MLTPHSFPFGNVPNLVVQTANALDLRDVNG